MKYSVTIGAFAIITNENNEVLFAHRNDRDVWNLPGGGLEKGEDPWDTVVREVKEETGLDVEVVKLLGVYTKPDQDDIVFNFKCQRINDSLRLNKEARDLRYFKPEDIPSNTLPRHIERVHDYFENTEGCLVVQSGDSKKILS